MVCISVALEACSLAAAGKGTWGSRESRALAAEGAGGPGIALCLCMGVQSPSEQHQWNCLSRLPPLDCPSEELLFSAG